MTNKDFQFIVSAKGGSNLPKNGFSVESVYTPDDKEMDRELVLRAFAFHRSGKEYRSPLKYFLNNELGY